MIKFRVGASIPVGNGKYERAEEVIELESEDRAQLEEVLWNLLDNLGVATWWEPEEKDNAD